MAMQSHYVNGCLIVCPSRGQFFFPCLWMNWMIDSMNKMRRKETTIIVTNIKKTHPLRDMVLRGKMWEKSTSVFLSLPPLKQYGSGGR